MFETILRTRRNAIDALVQTLTGGIVGLSESAIRDTWHDYLLKHDTLRREGWYMPPPHGMGVYFGSSPSYERSSFPNLRPETTWPSNEVVYETSDVITAYASPVDASTGLIGDVGVTLYQGSDKAVYDHLAVSLQLAYAIAAFAKIGMEFREIYDFALSQLSEYGFTNGIVSSTDPQNTNIGHTVPWSDKTPSSDELLTLSSGSDEQVAELISNKRVFINSAENYKVKDNLAFTIEPRPGVSGMPDALYHLIVVFENGEKQIISEFEPLFEMFGMSMPTPPRF